LTLIRLPPFRSGCNTLRTAEVREQSDCYYQYDVIKYRDSLDGISVDDLGGGFFEGWPNPPDTAMHLRILEGSSNVVLAWDEDSGAVVGFVNAISDGVLCAYIPLLEVLPAYRRQGIGSELMKRMLAKLSCYYMVDLVCDANMQSFYERFEMCSAAAMIIRRRERQDGR
jgi:ribosomal protein S18 acetylase RimI-like enzyme